MEGGGSGSRGGDDIGGSYGDVSSISNFSCSSNSGSNNYIGIINSCCI